MFLFLQPKPKKTKYNIFSTHSHQSFKSFARFWVMFWVPHVKLKHDHTLPLYFQFLSGWKWHLYAEKKNNNNNEVILKPLQKKTHYNFTIHGRNVYFSCSEQSVTDINKLFVNMKILELTSVFKNPRHDWEFRPYPEQNG